MTKPTQKDQVSEMSLEDHTEKRAEVVADAAETIGNASIASRQAGRLADATRFCFMQLFRVWLAAPVALRENTASLMEMIKGDFALTKKGAANRAVVEWDRMKELHDANPIHPAPFGTRADARKKGSKGARTQRRVLQNFGETVIQKFAVALDACRERGKDEDQLSYTQVCDILAQITEARCAGSRAMVFAGYTENDGRPRYYGLGSDYLDKFDIVWYPVDPEGHQAAVLNIEHEPEEGDTAGTHAQYLTLTVGAKRTADTLEVAVIRIASGKVYKASADLAKDARNGLTVANAFIRQAEDASIPEAFQIPEVAADPSDA